MAENKKKEADEAKAFDENTAKNAGNFNLANETTQSRP